MRQAPAGQRLWPATSRRTAGGGRRKDRETSGAGAPRPRPLAATAGSRRALRPSTRCRGRRDLAGSDEGGAPAGLGRRAESPPLPRPAGVNKAATRAAHLPAAAAPRPLSPGGPDRVGPGQKNRTQARRRRRRRRRRRANAGQARAASSGGAVAAAPEVLGAVASLPARGRPAVAGVATGAG
ncbi:PREDICTED: LOW QUALITY PROTEIN: uncharacterized protein ARIH2OS [Capra hircus]|uniref:LOW QUALITY PROTEIN: uncharacterized protein ARIH2OS n=1 Tax=Capra hircus TaxID=9925 RepID=UPI00084781B2|nr:PREDICTED: LOW QUALITY PROTEIN: uncharacterized protein ARIH2OS [Capra hircus]